MSSLKIEVTIAGHKFSLAYDVPDAAGEISPTDLNATWLDERLRAAIRPVLGRAVLRSREQLIAVPIEAPKPSKRPELRTGTL